MTSAVPSFGAGANALKNSSTGKSQKLIAAVSMRPMSLHRWLSGRSLQPAGRQDARNCRRRPSGSIRGCIRTALGSGVALDKAKADRATAQKRQRRQNPRKRQSAYRSIRSVFSRLRCDFGTCSSKEAPAIERHRWSSNGKSTVMRRGVAQRGVARSVPPFLSLAVAQMFDRKTRARSVGWIVCWRGLAGDRIAARSEPSWA